MRSIENIKSLSMAGQQLFITAKDISDYYNEHTTQVSHVLMSLSFSDGPVKDYLESYGVTLEFLSEYFYDEVIDYNALFDISAKNRCDENFSMYADYSLMITVKNIIASKKETDELVYPEDILYGLIQSRDKSIMTIIAEKIENYEEFIFGARELKLKVNIMEDNSNTSANKKTPSRKTKQINHLDRFSQNLVEEAKNGNLDSVSGRDTEIGRLVEVLGRKKKSNPCLVGEPGVGKTAIIEGLAQKIADGDVPNFLKYSKIYSININSLMAGSRYRGDLESKLEGIIKSAEGNSDVILFFDEIHNMVASGSADGSLDIGNILKPYLARGTVRCIGATTNKEYKKYIEKDGALERRFQKVVVDEPSIKDCVNMLKKAKSEYESFHKVKISEDAITCAVELSDRYVTERQLPDKAFDLMDEACSNAKIANHFIVEKEDIVSILYRWTGIPTETLNTEKSDKVLKLGNYLKSKIIGQDDAIDSVSRAIIRSHAGLNDPNKPIASFIFSGSTGVGKTALARCIGEYLFDDKKSLIKIDMSEYMEKVSVSKLIGSSPGYVGYKEGGQLTEAVRKKPYSIILLDEMEKAHPDVMNVFLQILDTGTLTDGQGKTVNFKNTILIFTSNLYNPTVTKRTIGFPTQETDKNSNADLKGNAIKCFSSHFSPEFINRFDDILVFEKLDKDKLIQILDLTLDETKRKLKKKGVKFTISKKSKLFLIDKCGNTNFGARPLKRTVSKYVEDELSFMLVKGDLVEDSILKITCTDKKLNFKILEADSETNTKVKKIKKSCVTKK